jgi:DNA-binding XRE family transcriptional regulator
MYPNKISMSVEVKKSIFLETFGESPLIKVLDFFLTFPGFDYSKTQVAKEAGISRITIEKIWDGLIKRGIIIKIRSIGKAELYKLNTDNPRVKILMKIGIELASSYFEETKRKIAVPA